MQTQKEIKNRISSTKSINKITKAMFLMSTVKSQKAFNEFQKFKDYISLLQNSIKKMEVSLDLNKKFENTYFVILTSDLGLAGSYNTDVIKKALKEFKKGDKFLLIGKKSKSIIKNLELTKEDFDYINLDKLKEKGLGKIIDKIIDSYKNNNYKVSIIFSKFISQIETESTIMQILPVINLNDNKESLDTTKDNIYDFEPSLNELYPSAILIYLDIFINWLLKEVELSEQISRKQAMDNATKNGQDMIDALNIKLNKTRQSKITQEISEIIGGAEALK